VTWTEDGCSWEEMPSVSFSCFIQALFPHLAQERDGDLRVAPVARQSNSRATRRFYAVLLSSDPI
jgi:hypothetical protein